jgi:glycosyltransferase involved in cell wall biosynthesis
MNGNTSKVRVAIIAGVPLWTLPGLEHLRHNRHYATWLEPLIPEFHAVAEEQGLDLHWITMCKETREDIQYEAYGQTFHILSRGSTALQMVTGYATEILRIRKVLRGIHPDIIHAWGSEDVAGLAGAFSGYQHRIFTLQGCLTEYLRLLGGSALFRIQTMYEKPTVARYRKATAESPGAAELLRALNPSLDITLVDYGVNPAFFDANWKPAALPEVLFLGSIGKRKGIADLIEVAKRPELSHIRFKIAGEGELRAQLEAHSPVNVEWLGKLDRPAVIRHMESAWALVVPTYSDTGPTVIKEARVVGLPIITTTAAGASSYVTDSGCGLVGEPGDQTFLVSSLLSVCVSREEVIDMGRKDWEEQRAQLHPRATANNFAALYQILVRI